jgi:hypothetical protein
LLNILEWNADDADKADKRGSLLYVIARSDSDEANQKMNYKFWFASPQAARNDVQKYVLFY